MQEIDDVTRAIQLALAPVFLLTGIAGLLSVMSARLSRIIDRLRALVETPIPGMSADVVSLEKRTLERRRHLTSVAITSLTIGALIVCMVIATLFLEAMLETHVKWVIGSLFTIAMMAVVNGLGFFLREVHIAMQSVRVAAVANERRGVRGAAGPSHERLGSGGERAGDHAKGACRE